MLKSLIILELIFLSLGIVLPLAKITEFWLFSDQFSVLSLSFRLMTEGEVLLGAVVLTFGVILPIFKIIVKLTGLKRFLDIGLHKAGMIDVFLFSFLVFASKVSEYFTLSLEIGFYCLLIAVLLSILREVIIYYVSREKEVE